MNVNPGLASSYVFSRKPGDKVTISGPYGEFFIQKKERRGGQQDGGSQAEDGDDMTGLTAKQLTQALVREKVTKRYIET